MAEIITEYNNKKIYDYLKESSGGSVLFIFNHGLGDLIIFLSIFENIKKLFPNHTFKIGTPDYRKNHCVHPDVLCLGDNFRSMIRYYKYIFRVGYPEPSISDRKKGIRKPYLCNITEFGIPNFIWKPYKFDNFEYIKDSKIVGVHFTGCSNPKNKNIDFDIMEKIWKDIESFGYTPIETHMESSQITTRDFPKFINSKNSLRFLIPDLQIVINKIKECSFFFGIDSGPFYLACSILGTDKCIFLKNMMEIDWYFPYPIKVIDTKNYIKNDIKKHIKNLK